MDRKKLVIAGISAAVCIAVVAAGGTSPQHSLAAAVGTVRSAAFLSAGITLPEPAAEEAAPQTSDEPDPGSAEPPAEEPVTENAAPETAEAASEEPEAPRALVISENIAEFDDGLDYAAKGEQSGVIIREHFTGYQGTDYITLPGGGQVWNCTSDSAESVLSAAGKLPELTIEMDSAEPQVLIVHTHTTESYEPYQRTYYDSSFPFRTRDPRHNMIRVGEALAERLASHGISVLHDGTIHDYPAYTGAYDRSEATIRAALEKYPSIKVIIDLHRDAMSSADGSRTAPAFAVNGRSAAQFMIITGCDDGRFGNMPEYRQNLSLACLIQQSAEELYPGLSRPVLFDYRNYNQHISTGSLLIEVGSHANSLDEAVYTGELLGDCMAQALSQLAADVTPASSAE